MPHTLHQCYRAAPECMLHLTAISLVSSLRSGKHLLNGVKEGQAAGGAHAVPPSPSPFSPMVTTD